MAAGGKEMEIAIKIAGKVESSFKNALSAATKGLGNITKAVASATAAAASAVAAMGIAAINTGREFEGAMSQVAATMLLDKTTEEGQKAFETLEDAARECGASTAFSATEAAEALNYLALAGYDAEKAAAALPTVLKLAGAGAMELGQASDMVTDSMSALGIEATEENLTNFADKLAQTASKSNTSVAQLGEAILTVGGTAQGLAGGTTELNAALGILADNGIKAAEGGTHLRNMLLSLQNARNSDAAALFEKMGLSAYDAEGRMRSLGDVFGDLNASLAGASAQDVNNTLSTIFKQTDLASARAMLAATADSVESLGAILDASLAESGTSTAALGINLQEMAAGFDMAMTQEQFTAEMLDKFGMSSEQAATLFTGLQSVVGGTGNRFEELSTAIENSTGACENMYAIQLDNLNGDIDILKSGLSDLGISIYKDLNEPLREMTQLGSSMVGELSEAYKSGGMQGMVGTVGDCLSEVVNEIAGYAPKIVSMGVDLINSFVRGIAVNAGTLADTAAQLLTIFVSSLFELVPQVILVGIDIITQLAASIAGQLPTLISNGIQAITNFLSGIKQRLPGIVSIGIDIIKTLTEGIKNNLPQMIPAAMEALLSFSASLRENVGNIVDVGLEMIMALAQSFIDNIPVFIETVPTIITNICGIINDNAPKLLTTGIILIGKLVTGLIQAIPVLVANIPKIIQAIVSVFTAFNWLSLGSKIVTTVGKGLHTMLPNLLSKGTQLVSSIARGITNGLPAVIQNGVHIISGFIQGIGAALPNILQSGLQIILSLLKGILANLPTIIQSAIKLVLSFASGLLSAAPTILSAIGQLILSIGDAILSTDWLGIGIQIIKELINGIISTGKSLWNAIKSLFTGDDVDIPNASEQSAAVVGSYASGINSNAGTVTVAVGSMVTNAFNGIDTSGAAEAGTMAGTAFSTGLTDSMAIMGTTGATALSTGFDTGLAGNPIDTSGILDTAAFSADMAATGNMGSTAIGTGMTENSQMVIQAAATMGNDVNTALDSGWNKANTNARTAMQRLTTTVTDAARSAANAVKAAFENMTITLPKPKLPNISVSTSSVSYGDGGNVNVPNFSVNWNALGGIFDQPTIFNTPAGMQGVGEKGPEAILPLDTLWAKMKEILNEAAAANSGASLIDAFIEKLKGIGTGGSGGQPELAGAGGSNIIWNPTYNLYGSAGKEEVVEADRMSQAEFKRMMKQYEKDQRRRKL